MKRFLSELGKFIAMAVTCSGYSEPEKCCSESILVWEAVEGMLDASKASYC